MTESEWQTRKQRIDARLRSMNPPWKIVRYRDGLDFAALDCHAVEELPTATGPADYALFVGGKLLGIIEAKKVTVTSLSRPSDTPSGRFKGQATGMATVCRSSTRPTVKLSGIWMPGTRSLFPG